VEVGVNRQLILVALEGKADVTDFIFMIDTDLSPETVSSLSFSLLLKSTSSHSGTLTEQPILSLFLEDF